MFIVESSLLVLLLLTNIYANGLASIPMSIAYPIAIKLNMFTAFKYLNALGSKMLLNNTPRKFKCVLLIPSGLNDAASWIPTLKFSSVIFSLTPLGSCLKIKSILLVAQLNSTAIPGGTSVAIR